MIGKPAGLLLVLVVLAGCGGGESAVETTTTAATTSSTVTGDPVVPIEVSPCDLLTAEEVEAATGLAVEEVRDEPPISCAFDLGTEAGVRIEVIIEDGEGRFGGAANLLREYLLLVDAGEAQLITDVGDRAVCCPFRAIAVDAGGGRYFAVAVGGGYGQLAEPLAVLVRLAESVLDRL